EPPAKWHPVVAMGRLAAYLERVLRARASLFSADPDRGLFLAGTAGCLALALAFCLPAALATLLPGLVHPALGAFCASACLWLTMAPRSLAEHARAVLRPLARGSLPEARRMLVRIVGRETAELDAHAAARACVESVAENSTDGVTASLFWAFAGYLAGGFPLAAACCVLHRAVNTLDAMWGRTDSRYLFFGRFAARFDDVLNWLPARLSLPCTALAACLIRGLSGREAWRVGLGDRRAHESPNSAWCEAAFSGGLGLRLGGPARYAGRARNHPWLGEGTPDAKPRHIAQAVRLMHREAWLACALYAALAGLSTLI
ncbi:MAG: adenosylcobinamide-phosphate synthase CbiB, partial [Desulfovibrionaceae bacterium]|nr:adenosylcobinamide-phosphate synthase CbiB [Desulfovibrionaceae bacterium]